MSRHIYELVVLVNILVSLVAGAPIPTGSKGAKNRIEFSGCALQMPLSCGITADHRNYWRKSDIALTDIYQGERHSGFAHAMAILGGLKGAGVDLTMNGRKKIVVHTGGLGARCRGI